MNMANMHHEHGKHDVDYHTRFRHFTCNSGTLVSAQVLLLNFVPSYFHSDILPLP